MTTSEKGVGERALTFEERAVAAGHTLILNEDGEVDHFVCDSGHHNGPGCSVCGWSQCHHCGGEIEPCDGGKWKREYEAKERVRNAAPDLLEVARWIQRVARSPEAVPESEWTDDERSLMAAVDAALSKATGTEAQPIGEG